MNDDADRVTITDDAGETLREIDIPPEAEVDHSPDGSITTIVRPDDDCRVLVDIESDIGARIHQKAAERGQSLEEFVLEAVGEFIERQEVQRR